jgi:ubiquinone/menaquinone biosynthesis C-methylase UbiE
VDVALASKFLQQRRLAHVMPHLEGPLLDVGCGDCTVAEYASGYVGIDSNRTFLPAAGQSPAPRVQGWADRLPFKEGSFKTVLAMAVLEHVSDPGACLREALRVLAPGGRFVMTTPTPIGDHIHHWLAKANITSKHAADEHQSVMSPENLRKIIEDAGFDVDYHHVFLFGGNQVCVAQRRSERTATVAGALHRALLPEMPAQAHAAAHRWASERGDIIDERTDAAA